MFQVLSIAVRWQSLEIFMVNWRQVGITGKLETTSFLQQSQTGTDAQEFSNYEAKLEGMDAIIHRGANYLRFSNSYTIMNLCPSVPYPPAKMVDKAMNRIRSYFLSRDNFDQNEFKRNLAGSDANTK